MQKSYQSQLYDYHLFIIKFIKKERIWGTYCLLIRRKSVFLHTFLKKPKLLILKQKKNEISIYERFSP